VTDAAFALLVVRVHDPINDGGVGGKGAGGAQKSVDQGGLAVVDVRDKGNVTECGGIHSVWFTSARGRVRECELLLVLIIFVIVKNDAVFLCQCGVFVILFGRASFPTVAKAAVTTLLHGGHPSTSWLRHQR
jgi:hypothetical protein